MENRKNRRGLAPPFFICSIVGMSHGQYGFDPHKAHAHGESYRALRTVSCWLMGRTHLADAIDDALRLAVREQDATRPKASKTARRLAVADLRAWIKTSPHLPSDLVEALRVMLPEIRQASMADEWPVGQDEWPEG